MSVPDPLIAEARPPFAAVTPRRRAPPWLRSATRRKRRRRRGARCRVLPRSRLSRGDHSVGALVRRAPVEWRRSRRDPRRPNPWRACTAPSSAIGPSAAGWLSRAQTMLTEAPESSQAGWVALERGHVRGRPLAEGITIPSWRSRLGRHHRDRELECATLAYLGASLVHSDRTEEGMMLLDEALASVAGGDVDDFIIVEEVFCQLFSACEHAHDVNRADQWIRMGDAIAESRNLPIVTAFCRTHYGGVLTAAGRWPEAEATLSEAIRPVGARPALVAAGGRRGAARRPARAPRAARGSRAAARRDRREHQRGGRASARRDLPRSR